jgi:hypothetical protein
VQLTGEDCGSMNLNAETILLCSLLGAVSPGHPEHTIASGVARDFIFTTELTVVDTTIGRQIVMIAHAKNVSRHTVVLAGYLGYDMQFSPSKESQARMAVAADSVQRATGEHLRFRDCWATTFPIIRRIDPRTVDDVSPRRFEPGDVLSDTLRYVIDDRELREYKRWPGEIVIPYSLQTATGDPVSPKSRYLPDELRVCVPVP